MQDRTQEDLAAAAGVTRNFVSAIERGAQGLDAVRLRKLAAEMGMSMADLLAEPSGESLPNVRRGREPPESRCVRSCPGRSTSGRGRPSHTDAEQVRGRPGTRGREC